MFEPEPFQHAPTCLKFVIFCKVYLGIWSSFRMHLVSILGLAVRVHGFMGRKGNAVNKVAQANHIFWAVMLGHRDSRTQQNLCSQVKQKYIKWFTTKVNRHPWIEKWGTRLSTSLGDQCYSTCRKLVTLVSLPPAGYHAVIYFPIEGDGIFSKPYSFYWRLCLLFPIGHAQLRFSCNNAHNSCKLGWCCPVSSQETKASCGKL